MLTCFRISINATLEEFAIPIRVTIHPLHIRLINCALLLTCKAQWIPKIYPRKKYPGTSDVDTFITTQHIILHYSATLAASLL
jgi:hypothetical protein